MKKQNTFGKIFTNLPVIKNTIKRIAFAHESSIIFQPLLNTNVPAESPSYAPTFFYRERNTKTRISTGNPYSKMFEHNNHNIHIFYN